MALLELHNVCKSFDGACVLKDVNATIAQGEFVAIVGFSGAGKTTLMSLMSGLLMPDTGVVTLDNKPIQGPGPDRGVVFQNYSLLPWLTVFENIALAVDRVFADWDAERRRKHVERFLHMVHLTAARDKRPAQLSGGMRQRVSVARALAMDPRILLMDEPLSALDALTRATLQDEIARIREETRKTVVWITNDPDEGLYLADRILPLTAGPAATLGPPFTVDLPWPRDRKAIHQDGHFKRLRRDVTEFLLGSRKVQRATVTRRLVLPDIEPEDLSVLKRLGAARAFPKRAREIKEEQIEV